MPVTYLIKFQVVPDRRVEFLQPLKSVLDAMRSEPMFHEAILHKDPAIENRFMLYETWESHEDVLEVQLHRPYRQAWHEALPRLLQGERDITIWEVTDGETVLGRGLEFLITNDDGRILVDYQFFPA